MKIRHFLISSLLAAMPSFFFMIIFYAINWVLIARSPDEFIGHGHGNFYVLQSIQDVLLMPVFIYVVTVLIACFGGLFLAWTKVLSKISMLLLLTIAAIIFVMVSYISASEFVIAQLGALDFLRLFFFLFFLIALPTSFFEKWTGKTY